jgi:phage terminase large subunit-like protein
MLKLTKGKSGDKVDGPVSIVMALGTYLQESQKEKEQDFWFIDL